MSEASRVETRLLRLLLPILILGGGAAIFLTLKMTKPQAKKAPQDDRGLLVEVTRVEVGDHEVEVEAQGRVIPARQVTLSPEVAGRIVWQHEDLVPGGTLSAGTAVLRLDRRDYELAAQQQQAAVDRAKLELEIERSRKKVAEREWELLGNEAAGDTSDNLALREPQLRTAKVAVEAAESGLDRARLAVNKTVVKAPFNALVQGEQTEIGQLVGPQAPLATLVGTDHFWVQVSIPIDNLASIAVPGINAKEGAGSVARVWQQVGGQTIERSGRVVRLLGDLDPTGGMARLLVEIDDPLGLERDQQDGIPMLIGAFVHVRIAAGTIRDAVEIPRTALREGERIFTIDGDGRLAVSSVTIAWRNPETVLVSSGLAPGDRVVTSEVGDAIPGTKVRTQDDQPADEPATAEAPPAKDAT